MPAERSAKRNLKAGSAASRQVSKKAPAEPCNICGQVLSRSSDMARHMKRHDRSVRKLSCPWNGCHYSTLQKSNLDTHFRRHTGDKRHICKDSTDCIFRTCDRASLLRHRKSLHGYKPKKQKKNGGKISLVSTLDLPSSSSLNTPSLNDASISPPSLCHGQWDLDISTLSDILNYLHFCADMESLNSLGPQIPYQV